MGRHANPQLHASTEIFYRHDRVFLYLVKNNREPVNSGSRSPTEKTLY